jgi:hypothetical protein
MTLIDAIPVIVGLPLALLAVGYVIIRALRLVMGIRPKGLKAKQPDAANCDPPYTVTDPNQALKAAGRKWKRGNMNKQSKTRVDWAAWIPLPTRQEHMRPSAGARGYHLAALFIMTVDTSGYALVEKAPGNPSYLVYSWIVLCLAADHDTDQLRGVGIRSRCDFSPPRRGHQTHPSDQDGRTARKMSPMGHILTPTRRADCSTGYSQDGQC